MFLTYVIFFVDDSTLILVRVEIKTTEKLKLRGY
jgi:hypothetical protein